MPFGDVSAAGEEKMFDGFRDAAERTEWGGYGFDAGEILVEAYMSCPKLNEEAAGSPVEGFEESEGSS